MAALVVRHPERALEPGKARAIDETGHNNIWGRMRFPCLVLRYRALPSPRVGCLETPPFPCPCPHCMAPGSFHLGILRCGGVVITAATIR